MDCNLEHSGRNREIHYRNCGNKQDHPWRVQRGEERVKSRLLKNAKAELTAEEMELRCSWGHEEKPEVVSH